MILYDSMIGSDLNSECESADINQNLSYCCKTNNLSNRCLIKSISGSDEIQIMEKENSPDNKCFACDDLVLVTESSYHLKQIKKGMFREKFHLQCLVCSKCSCILTESDNQCWIRNGKVICKDCKKRMTHCQRCNTLVSGDAWVHRLNDFPFHISCFTCCICTRQLTKGEKCSLIEDRLFCHEHFLEICNGKTENSSDSSGKNKLKRIRTSFTPEQLAILQAHFDSECNPDGQELEKIANSAQLNKRVTQVWFQNARARKKKTGKTCMGTSSLINGNIRYSSSLCADSNSNNGFLDSIADDDKLSTDSSSCTSTPISGFRFNDSNQLGSVNPYSIPYPCNNSNNSNNNTNNNGNNNNANNNNSTKNEKNKRQINFDNEFKKINHQNNIIIPHDTIYSNNNCNVWNKDFMDLYQNQRRNTHFD